MATLQSLVQTLPQEIYDEIYELTFTSHEREYHIDSNHKPPACLHVSRETREKFARSYYGNGTIFYVQTLRHAVWYSSLPTHHPALVEQHVRVKNPQLRAPCSCGECVNFALVLAFSQARARSSPMWTKVRMSGFYLKFLFTFDSGETSKWLSGRDIGRRLRAGRCSHRWLSQKGQAGKLF